MVMLLLISDSECDKVEHGLDDWEGNEDDEERTKTEFFVVAIQRLEEV